MNKVKARYFKTLENGDVRCLLCPHACLIKSNDFGLCKTRENIDGTLYAPFYGKASSIAIDPIEKKPLYHFYPGSSILSVGTVGCSFHCLFCQNYSISQYTDIHTEDINVKDLDLILKQKHINMIAFTYSEPLIWFETVLDFSKELKKINPDYKIVLVTNGYINIDPLNELLPYVDAMNIDLKSFNNSFYQKYCQGTLEPVLNVIRIASKNTHVELTTLVIPGLNDTEDEMEAITKFIASINPDIPLHISRYYPCYKMSTAATSEETISDLTKIAKKNIHYVYPGNVFNLDDSTTCECGNRLIIRKGFSSKIVGIKENKCTECGKNIYGFF